MRPIDLMALVLAVTMMCFCYTAVGFSDRLTAMTTAQVTTNKRLSAIEAKLQSQIALDNELLILSSALQPPKSTAQPVPKKGKHK